jgi:hypothetical protein
MSKSKNACTKTAIAAKTSGLSALLRRAKPVAEIDISASPDVY